MHAPLRGGLSVERGAAEHQADQSCAMDRADEGLSEACACAEVTQRGPSGWRACFRSQLGRAVRQ